MCLNNLQHEVQLKLEMSSVLTVIASFKKIIQPQLFQGFRAISTLYIATSNHSDG